MNAHPFLSEAELARRRTASRRMAWALGALVLALYAAGMFVSR